MSNKFNEIMTDLQQLEIFVQKRPGSTIYPCATPTKACQQGEEPAKDCRWSEEQLKNLPNREVPSDHSAFPTSLGGRSNTISCCPRRQDLEKLCTLLDMYGGVPLMGKNPGKLRSMSGQGLPLRRYSMLQVDKDSCLPPPQFGQATS